MSVKLLMRILGYVKPYRWRLAASALCIAGYSLTLGGLMFMIKLLFDDMTQPASAPYLSQDVVFFILLYVFRGVFQYLKDYLIVNVTQKVVMDVRNQLYHHLQHLSLKFYTRERSGQLIQTVTNDTVNLQAIISNMFGTTVDTTFQVVILVGVMMKLNWRMALIGLLVFPFGVGVLYRFGRRLRQISRDRQGKIGEIMSKLQESIAGIRIIKAFSMEAHEVERFRRLSRDWFDLMMKDLKISAISGPVMDFLGGMGIIAMIWYSGRQIIDGTWTIGSFMAFGTSMLSLYKPLHHLNGLNAQIQQALVSGERIFGYLDTPPDVVDRPNAVECPGIRTHLTLKHVSFRYEGDVEVLRNVSVDIKRGQLVALVGPSGAGKSTLADVLMRFYDPSSGTVELDGRDLREYRQESYRRHVGMVTQDVILFNDTVAANIAYGKPQATREEIIEAAKFANADGFIQAMPQGYESFVGERGTALSGGQRQRIAIARALLKNPELLILDEATSALDAESEALVQDALDRLMVNRTSVVIAHRLSTVAKADAIVVLEQGQVVDVGPHSALIKRCALYQRLHALQFEALSSHQS